MNIKDILVHLDGSEWDSRRCAVAFSLVERFGARLTGLFARVDGHAVSALAHRESERLEGIRHEAEQAFLAACGPLGIQSRFWHTSHGEKGGVISEVSACARFFDLVVLGQGEEGGSLPEKFAEQVVLQSGRPCIIAPETMAAPTFGTNVLVAWNGSRECTRALHDAMPLIENAGYVEVVSVLRSGGQPEGHSHPPANIVDHLSAHGVKVIREKLVSDNGEVMDLILSRAYDLGADLLVMGGYGNPKFSLLDRSNTRRAVRQTSLPVLLAR
ncbi:MAG: universal stress protein [Magnetospirillum sp.]|nr:universal stress protein [Magnetospirillum sp.]